MDWPLKWWESSVYNLCINGNKFVSDDFTLALPLSLDVVTQMSYSKESYNRCRICDVAGVLRIFFLKPRPALIFNDKFNSLALRCGQLFVLRPTQSLHILTTQTQPVYVWQEGNFIIVFTFYKAAIAINNMYCCFIVQTTLNMQVNSIFE